MRRLWVRSSNWSRASLSPCGETSSGEAFHLGRQRHRAAHRGARALRGLDDFARGAVDQAVIERLRGGCGYFD